MAITPVHVVNKRFLEENEDLRRQLAAAEARAAEAASKLEMMMTAHDLAAYRADKEERLASALEAENALLRRVAEAGYKVRAQFDGVQDWSWATKGISFAMVDLWDALAALDAAQEQKSEEVENDG